MEGGKIQLWSREDKLASQWAGDEGIEGQGHLIAFPALDHFVPVFI